MFLQMPPKRKRKLKKSESDQTEKKRQTSEKEPLKEADAQTTSSSSSSPAKESSNTKEEVKGLTALLLTTSLWKSADQLTDQQKQRLFATSAFKRDEKDLSAISDHKERFMAMARSKLAHMITADEKGCTLTIQGELQPVPTVELAGNDVGARIRVCMSGIIKGVRQELLLFPVTVDGGWLGSVQDNDPNMRELHAMREALCADFPTWCISLCPMFTYIVNTSTGAVERCR
jgi:hypothetical protein